MSEDETLERIKCRSEAYIKDSFRADDSRMLTMMAMNNLLLIKMIDEQKETSRLLYSVLCQLED